MTNYVLFNQQISRIISFNMTHVVVFKILCSLQNKLWLIHIDPAELIWLRQREKWTSLCTCRLLNRKGWRISPHSVYWNSLCYTCPKTNLIHMVGNSIKSIVKVSPSYKSTSCSWKWAAKYLPNKTNSSYWLNSSLCNHCWVIWVVTAKRSKDVLRVENQLSNKYAE